MNFDLTTYLKIYPVFDNKFCLDTINQLKQSKWETHSYTNPEDNYKSVSFDNEFSICYSDIENKKEIMEKIWNVYLQYLTDLNFKWFASWAGYSEVRFNKYDVNTLMREHCDHINSLFDGERKGVPTMTALGTLNDDYEGGELIFWNDKKVIIPPGNIAVFPSNFLYPHFVAPVKKGVRYSFVSWAW